jgi:predicted N-acetyltransferase YhbS
MDRMKWSDRHFQMLSSEHQVCTYVLKRGKAIVGYLSMHSLENGGLMIDEIAVDASQRGKDYGGVLMRFADTLARQGSCPVVRLLAIKQQASFYERFEYRFVEGKNSIRLDDEEYSQMEKAVLYHHSPVR